MDSDHSSGDEYIEDKKHIILNIKTLDNKEHLLRFWDLNSVIHALVQFAFVHCTPEKDHFKFSIDWNSKPDALRKTVCLEWKFIDEKDKLERVQQLQTFLEPFDIEHFSCDMFDTHCVIRID